MTTYAKHKAYLGEMRNAYRILIRNLKERNHTEDYV
jgi:effector-binding domain-containing protein